MKRQVRKKNEKCQKAVLNQSALFIIDFNEILILNKDEKVFSYPDEGYLQ